MAGAQEAPTGPAWLPVWLTCKNAIALTMGFLLSDLVSTRHEWLVHPSFVVHHIIGIVLVYFGMTAIPKELDRVIGPIVFLEASTIFLDLMYLLKVFGLGNSPLYHLCMKAFVAIFFVVRVILLPLYVRHLRANMPTVWRVMQFPGQLGLTSLCGLQWYWFSKIYRKFMSDVRE